MLHEFLAGHRDEIVKRSAAETAASAGPRSVRAGVDHGAPIFLDQLIDELRFGRSPSGEIARMAVQHGHDRLQEGFTVAQLVHDYGAVGQAITELAVELNVTISPDDFW